MEQGKNIFVIWGMLLCLLSSPARAQLPAISFEHLTTEHGLPSNTVFSATKDRQGFMWFGTRRCPVRYDGTSFRPFLDFETDFVLGLAADSLNNLWAATDRSGLCKIEATTLRMVSLPAPHRQPSKQTGNFFLDTRGQGWYSDWYGINRINIRTGEIRHYPFRQTHYAWVKASFLEDRQQNLWVIGSDNGLFRYDQQADSLICVLGADSQDPGRRFPILFTRGCVDQEGLLWIGTYGKGLMRYHPQTGAFDLFPTVTVPNSVLSVEEGRDENGQRMLWIGGREGLGVFRPEQKRFYWFTNLLPEPFAVHDIFRDPTEGIVWVCTSKGILKYHPASNLMQTFMLPAGVVPLPVEINAFLSDQTDSSRQTVWLGLSHTGLLWWQRKTNQFGLVPFPAGGGARETRWMVQRDDGTIWLGTYPGSSTNGNPILVYDPLQKEFVQTPLSRAANRLLSGSFAAYGFFDQRQRLWLGNSDDGIRVLDSLTGKEVTPWDSLTFRRLFQGNNLLKDLRPDRRGRVWLATYQGVYLADEAGKRFINADSLNQAMQLEDPAVNSLFEDRAGNLWAARWGSVTMSDADGVLQRVLTGKEGLYDRENQGVVEDEAGNIWIGNYEGLHYYNPATGRLLRFTESDGLLNNSTLHRLYVHNGKELLIGQKNGVNVLPVDKLVQKPAPPRLAIGSFKVQGKEYPADFTRPIRLQREENAFSVDFAALNFRKLHNNQYAYFLENFDNEWTYSGSAHQAAYTNLSPGQYTLHLKAGDAFDHWSEPLRLQIEVLPAYYETWWFRGLLLLAVAGLLYAFYRYRIDQLLRLQQVRNRISADLHDEIGASLSGISIMGTMARQGLPAQDPAAPLLDRMIEEARQISSSLDDIVWSINPRNDELAILIARMARYASELLEAKGIEYRLSIPDHLSQTKLTMEQRRDFFLIFKETVNNLVKYSRCTHASLEIIVKRQHLRLLIRDNGVGFETEAPSERNGLLNLRRRAQNLKGSLLIQSAPGQGTAVQLDFPVSA